MGNFGFYGELGFFHVMDLAGYDHVLFLMALALPFGYAMWKRVLWLATLFTFSHCLALGLAAFDVVAFDSDWVEFLIPITIFLTALFDIYLARTTLNATTAFKVHLLSTGLFGLIHGLGFSNYFRMLMAGAENKLVPLFGFALGIEVAQIVVLLVVMSITYLFINQLSIDKRWYIRIGAVLIAIVSAFLIGSTWPG
ncbi:MAG: hypothetical protein RLZZ241_36 [Bacteroidota bacterium]|jgi:hypothetical protein